LFFHFILYPVCYLDSTRKIVQISKWGQQVNRQSIGLCLFLLGTLIAWGVIAWVLVWLPYTGALAAGLFTMVMVTYLFGVAAWLTGLIRALRKQATPLPFFGRWAERLPVR
jgi:uncharacterized membrane protein